jgi:hypothetical protein
VPDDERKEIEPTEDAPDVEGHGTKEVVGIGLAAAALIGGGAAAYKLTEDDANERSQAALVEREETSEPVELKAADRDGDGYLTSAELAHEGFKWSTEELREHPEVLAVGLALAGYKHSPDLVGDEGFMIKGESIMLKYGLSPELDKLLDSGAPQEWSSKWREVDRDGDGYANHEELEPAGWKLNTAQLEKAGYKFGPEDLAKAGYKLPSYALGEGGFAVEGSEVMLKHGADTGLDALLEKISPNDG